MVISSMVKFMRPLLLLACWLVVAHSAQQQNQNEETIDTVPASGSTSGSAPSGVVYLVDLLALTRPRPVDSSNEDADSVSNSVADEQGEPKRPTPLAAILLVNNPIRDEDATADGIYYRPIKGSPLDRDPTVSTLFEYFSSGFQIFIIIL